VTYRPLYPRDSSRRKTAHLGQEYNALIDSPEWRVNGRAYEVEARELEDKLRAYETGKYGVVLVKIVLKDGYGDGNG
jgi:hypothetical protein